jgi:hypothetical protein
VMVEKGDAQQREPEQNEVDGYSEDKNRLDHCSAASPRPRVLISPARQCQPL